MLSLHPLAAIGEVRPRDDLAALLAAALAAAGLAPAPGDVLVVTQKIVSKAEGRLADLAAVAPGARARELAAITRKDARLVELVLGESVEVLRAVPDVLIVRHRSGHVMANAGIDRSNVGPGGAELALLLPVDADASAAGLRDRLGVAVVVADSFGRPWRMGVTGVAIGAAGLPALLDRRGERDPDRRPPEATEVALADMLASAAALVAGEAAESVPAVLVRGLSWSAPERPAAALVRPLEQDLFR